ncbi:cellulase family glycosylhydrolase [Chitinophaga defluvii]|uniref:Cellulase family glycosylhydrolase n=1 Tax=Chitinophaga defluvii TaxID=3163343 RepID=A0ABV2T5T1_9BACT
MNRRASLKALAIGSASVIAPLAGWSHATGKRRAIAEDITEAAKPDDTTASVLAAAAAVAGSARRNVLHLVADSALLDILNGKLPSHILPLPRHKLNETELLGKLAGGDGMIWIGSPEGIPAALSVGAFRPSATAMTVNVADKAPMVLPDIEFNPAVVFSAYIAPPKEMPNHNIDEEVRADFLPVLEARDRFGNLAGYPGLLMSYYAPSLAEGRFMGSDCWFFLFSKPEAALETNGWLRLLQQVDARWKGGLQVYANHSNYAAYNTGERVQVRTRLQNHCNQAVAATMRYTVKAPGATAFTPLLTTRRVAAAGSDTEALCDFRPASIPGLWTIQLEILQDVEKATLLALEGEPVVVDKRYMGFMVQEASLQTPPILAVKGPSIVLDGEEGFWAGTHYYPSTSWWEWAWRDFHPLKAAEDFSAIRRAGYRIVRVWVDPVLDEPVLRAMDAAIRLAAANGVVLDICIFTQWARQMGFEKPDGEQVLFNYREQRDFNIVSFSLRNLELQRAFVRTLAVRWKNAGNVIYNLANEVYLKDPDDTQMDAAVRNWQDIPAAKGTVRDSLLFRRWANEMTAVIRDAGGRQPVMPGYMFSTMDGGDTYLANEEASILPWHNYLPPVQAGLTAQYFDPLGSNRPMIIEEFGNGKWNNLSYYDASVHYALAGGAAAAMSYEWGVSWLSRESCYWPLPLREASQQTPDPRWFTPYLELDKTWMERGVGLCPTPSGTGYGSICHGTPFPAPAAIALGRLGLMGKGLQRVAAPEKVYIIVPAGQLAAMEPVKQTLAALWAAKALFGVWQESALEALPAGTKAVICPHPLTNKAAFNTLKAKGVAVYEGPDAWRNCTALEKIPVSNGDAVNLLTRRTKNGILFTLAAKEAGSTSEPNPAPGKVHAVSLQYHNNTAGLALRDFGLVQVTTDGITLMEGEGELRINGALLCKVQEGRVILSTGGNNSLLRTKDLQLAVTMPTRITFAQKIAGIAVSDGFNQPVKAPWRVTGKELLIDDQLAKYIIHVSFV